RRNPYSACGLGACAQDPLSRKKPAQLFDHRALTRESRSKQIYFCLTIQLSGLNAPFRNRGQQICILGFDVPTRGISWIVLNRNWEVCSRPTENYKGNSG